MAGLTRFPLSACPQVKRSATCGQAKQTITPKSMKTPLSPPLWGEVFSFRLSKFYKLGKSFF
jgi:hypothetical protein